MLMWVYLRLHLWMYLWMPDRTLDALELELWAGVNWLMWVPGTELSPLQEQLSHLSSRPHSKSN